jgi:hypothetical protein
MQLTDSTRRTTLASPSRQPNAHKLPRTCPRPLRQAGGIVRVGFLASEAAIHRSRHIQQNVEVEAGAPKVSDTRVQAYGQKDILRYSFGPLVVWLILLTVCLRAPVLPHMLLLLRVVC